MKVSVTFECDSVDAAKQFQMALSELVTHHPEIRISALGGEKRQRAPVSPHVRKLTEELIAVWNGDRHGHEKIRMTESRLAKVQARLNDGFQPHQLAEVVQKLRLSPFHQGDNDRGWCASGPEWVLHTAERVEQWLSKTERKVKSYADEVSDFFTKGA